ncbi:MAG: hypothetical protein FWF08_07840 [Oscillospiraceae bacterium]|nr:hypothetical protein [Oscillospiraceae bacterium]
MKKVLSLILSLTMLFGLLAAAGINASAADAIIVYAWNEAGGGPVILPDVDPAATSLADILDYLGTIYPGVVAECTGMQVIDYPTIGSTVNEFYTVGDLDTFATLEDIGITFDICVFFKGFSRSNFTLVSVDNGYSRYLWDIMWVDTSVSSLGDILALLAGEIGKFTAENVLIDDNSTIHISADEADYDETLNNLLPFDGHWYIRLDGFERSITVAFVDDSEDVIFAFDGIFPIDVSLNDLLALLEDEIGDFDYDNIFIMLKNGAIFDIADYGSADFDMNIKFRFDVDDDVEIKLVGFVADDGDDGDDGDAVDVNGIVACFKKFLSFFTGLFNFIKEILLGAFSLQTVQGGFPSLGDLLGIKIDVGDLINGGNGGLGDLGDLFG